MRYLTCILDSESYTSSYLEVFDNRIAAEAYIEKWMEDNDYGDCDWENGKNRATGGDEEYWAVAEIIEVPEEAKYLIVEHHAYAGVDFTLDGTADNYEEAKNILESVKANILDDYSEGEIEDDEENEFLFDTGNEWIMAEIYEIK